MSLPAHYTPGRYKAARTPDGYGICTPSGQLVPGVGPYTTRAAAQEKADDHNTIRERLARA